MKKSPFQDREIRIADTSAIAVQSAVNLSKEKDSRWGAIVNSISEKDDRKADHHSGGQAVKYCKDQP
jgi:hypothetical protein